MTVTRAQRCAVALAKRHAPKRQRSVVVLDSAAFARVAVEAFAKWKRKPSVAAVFKTGTITEKESFEIGDVHYKALTQYVTVHAKGRDWRWSDDRPHIVRNGVPPRYLGEEL